MPPKTRNQELNSLKVDGEAEELWITIDFGASENAVGEHIRVVRRGLDQRLGVGLG